MYFTYWGDVTRHERFRYMDLWAKGLSPLDVDPEKIKLLEQGRHHHLYEEQLTDFSKSQQTIRKNIDTNEEIVQL